MWTGGNGDVVRVDHLTSPVLGKELSKRCGEGGSEQRLNLNNGGRRVLRFLTEVILLMPVVMIEADLQNTAFIFAQPGKEFVIVAGDGDWEFYFAESVDGDICCTLKRMPRKW